MIYYNITNSYLTHLTTGIQRVVREYLRYGVEYGIVPVVVSGKIYRVKKEGVRRYLANKQTLYDIGDVVKLEKGDIFFDVDSSWCDNIDYYKLITDIKSKGVIIVKMHYDAVPLLFPKYSHCDTVYKYSENIYAYLKLSDYWFVISNRVRDDLLKIASELKMPISNVTTVQLGSDIARLKPKKKSIGDNFLLFVGTIEPRKNIDLVIDVFDSVMDDIRDLKLVLVGKSGWNNREIINRIKNHKEYGYRLLWLSDVNDNELVYLYRHAISLVALSHYEGFGLPIVEALINQCPVICRSKSAMEDIAKGFAIIADTKDEVIDGIKKVYGDPSIKERIKQYKHPSWQETSIELCKALKKLTTINDFNAQIKQAVLISNRPCKFERCIESILKKMMFISEIVVMVPDEQEAEYKKIAQIYNSIKVIVIVESSIVQYNLKDHQRRNTYLRMELYKRKEIDKNFIALDDDCIIVSEVKEDYFIREGRHCGFYFLKDGREWKGSFPRPTSYDEGIFRTVNYLSGKCYDTKIYSSHQPQVINKEVACMILKEANDNNLDEWSSYFNIAKYRYPDLFVEDIYATIGWPSDEAPWVPDEVPSLVLFSNDVIISNKSEIEIRLQALIEKVKIEMEMRDSLPELIITKEKAFFTCDEVEIRQKRFLLINIMTCVEINSVIYKINNNDVYDSNINNGFIPDYVYIPVEYINEGEELEVLVIIQTDVNIYNARMRLRLRASRALPE